MPPDEFRIFLSAVTSEFGKARDELAADLGSREALLKVQRDFRQEAESDTTLRKLHNYIHDCSAVVCVIGRRSGAVPPPAAASRFAHMLPPGIATASYTQWEFFFARHYKRRLSIYIANDDYEPDKPALTGDDATLQQAFRHHLVDEQGLDRSYFSNVDQLCRAVLKEDWPKKRGPKPIVLPYPSIGTLFKGRGEFLRRLGESLARRGQTAIVSQALYGLGGIGKTRAAVEYAWVHADKYNAVLFVVAESPEALRRNLAALAGALVPNLDTTDDQVRLKAALDWLKANPGWFLVLDNVDTPAAMAEAERLLADLGGGQRRNHVVITSRLANFSAHVEPLALDVLGVRAGTAGVPPALCYLAWRPKMGGRDARGPGAIPSHLRNLEHRWREQLLNGELAIDQSLLACIAGQRLDLGAVLVNAVAPIILAHDGHGLERLGLEKWQRHHQSIDVAKVRHGEGLGLAECLVEARREPRVLREQRLADADEMHDRKQACLLEIGHLGMPRILEQPRDMRFAAQERRRRARREKPIELAVAQHANERLALVDRLEVEARDWFERRALAAARLLLTAAAPMDFVRRNAVFMLHQAAHPYDRGDLILRHANALAAQIGRRLYARIAANIDAGMAEDARHEGRYSNVGRGSIGHGAQVAREGEFTDVEFLVLKCAEEDFLGIERQIGDGAALDLHPPVHDRPRAVVIAARDRNRNIDHLASIDC
jgi:hypothetical protein